jgi:thioredoxin-like negative regulator of GroEL
VIVINPLKKKIRAEYSMNNLEKCTRIETEQDLEKILQTKDTCFILFYAEWCPFSLRFLPIFENCSKDTTHRCYRMRIDEHPHLCEKYSVEVYPTVVFFQKGIALKRLDGIHGVGLNERQLRELMNACGDRKQ